MTAKKKLKLIKKVSSYQLHTCILRSPSYVPDSLSAYRCREMHPEPLSLSPLTPPLPSASRHIACVLCVAATSLASRGDVVVSGGEDSCLYVTRLPTPGSTARDGT